MSSITWKRRKEAQAYMKRSLREHIGIIIVKHLGSRNPSYPTDSYTAHKFVALADELAVLMKMHACMAEVMRRP